MLISIFPQCLRAFQVEAKTTKIVVSAVREESGHTSNFERPRSKSKPLIAMSKRENLPRCPGQTEDHKSKYARHLTSPPAMGLPNAVKFSCPTPCSH